MMKIRSGRSRQRGAVMLFFVLVVFSIGIFALAVIDVVRVRTLHGDVSDTVNAAARAGTLELVTGNSHGAARQLALDVLDARCDNDPVFNKMVNCGSAQARVIGQRVEVEVTGSISTWALGLAGDVLNSDRFERITFTSESSSEACGRAEVRDGCVVSR